MGQVYKFAEGLKATVYKSKADRMSERTYPWILQYVPSPSGAGPVYQRACVFFMKGFEEYKML